MNEIDPELPFEASQQVELPLSAEQAKQLKPILALQLCRPGSAIWLGLAQSYVPGVGAGVLRIQLKLCGKKTSAKAIKLLRSPDSNE
jgi:hypothetical protein